MVFNQRKWPGAGDVDDCWVVSAIQAMHVTAPWLRLVGVKEFRKAAGRPDVQGEANGGQLRHVKLGCEGVFPQWYRAADGPRIRVVAGGTWDQLKDDALEHRPLSVAVVSAKLPARLQFGFGGYHQITVVAKASGRWLVANPLAPAYSRWVEVNPSELRPAVVAYGRDKSGRPGAWYVRFPTDEEMAARYHAVDDDTPFDQDDIDAATAALAADNAELQGRIDSAIDVLDGAEL